MIDASQQTHDFSFLLSICVEEQRSKQKVFYLKLKLCIRKLFDFILPLQFQAGEPCRVVSALFQVAQQSLQWFLFRPFSSGRTQKRLLSLYRIPLFQFQQALPGLRR